MSARKPSRPGTVRAGAVRPGTVALGPFISASSGQFKQPNFLQGLKVSPRRPVPQRLHALGLYQAGVLPSRPHTAAAAATAEEADVPTPAAPLAPMAAPLPKPPDPPFVLVDEAPAWLLFPSIPREGRENPPISSHAYKPKRVPVERANEDATYREVYAVLRRTRIFRSITDRDLATIVGLGRVVEYPRCACPHRPF